VLFALWLLATMDGVGSARELDRLTSQDLAYRWVACGVPVNYHGLADFRVAHADVLDDLLTETLAAFMAERLFDADEIVVDGTKSRLLQARVRTSARCVWTRRRRQRRPVLLP
jgi:transposase